MKIWRKYHKYHKKYYYYARFQAGGKNYQEKAETKKELKELVNEIKYKLRPEKLNKKYKKEVFKVTEYQPTLLELFNKYLDSITDEKRHSDLRRTYKRFLDLLPKGIKVNELTRSAFQSYYDTRKKDIVKGSGQPPTDSTIYREMYSMTKILNNGGQYFPALENYNSPTLPKKPKSFKPKARRERLVKDNELFAIINELKKKIANKQHYFARVRLAHVLEFQNETGFRRKEIFALKFSQFDESRKGLINVKRFKTDTEEKFFPLSKIALEIIIERKELQADCKFIFSPNGKPLNSMYRTLKTVCDKLNLSYGKYKDGGFVMHDLRHNFGTQILRRTDLETARTLLGHSDIKQTQTYIHTDESRLREAVDNRDLMRNRVDELKELFELVQDGKINESEFIEVVERLYLC